MRTAKGEQNQSPHSPQSIHPHSLHELPHIPLRHPLHRNRNPRIRKENVQTTILLQRLIHHTLDIRFRPRVDFTAVDRRARVQRLDFALVRLQVLGVQIAEENRLGAVVRELVRGCPADAQRRVGARDDYDFAFDSTVFACNKRLLALRSISYRSIEGK